MTVQNTGQVITGTVGGNHVADGPLTTSVAAQASPELLTNDIDNRVVKIRPMATPIDQISRMVGARPVSSMKVEYYSVDTRPVETVVKGSIQEVEDIAEDQPPHS